MGRRSAISWTDATWPLLRGCRRCASECENFYLCVREYPEAA